MVSHRLLLVLLKGSLKHNNMLKNLLEKIKFCESGSFQIRCDGSSNEDTIRIDFCRVNAGGKQPKQYYFIDYSYFITLFGACGWEIQLYQYKLAGSL